MRYSHMTIAIALVLISGCLRTGELTDAEREAIGGSPSLKRAHIDKCVKDNANATADQRALFIKYMNVSPKSDVVRILCTRLVGGLIAGRITSAEIRAESPSAELIRVMQGR